jgi:hypothetical protein
MRVSRAVALLVVLLSVGTAEAGWLGGGKRLPQAYSPVLRGAVHETQKPVPRARHPRRYQEATWGSPRHLLFRPAATRTAHYNRIN